MSVGGAVARRGPVASGRAVATGAESTEAQPAEPSTPPWDCCSRSSSPRACRDAPAEAWRGGAGRLGRSRNSLNSFQDQSDARAGRPWWNARPGTRLHRPEYHGEDEQDREDREDGPRLRRGRGPPRSKMGRYAAGEPHPRPAAPSWRTRYQRCASAPCGEVPAMPVPPASWTQLDRGTASGPRP